MAAERVPDYAEHPGYGIYPCNNEFHTKAPPWDGKRYTCPDCTNTWWAADGTECPEEYALIAEIDQLRLQLESKE